jgi:amino acid adenylation domain-containing protein
MDDVLNVAEIKDRTPRSATGGYYPPLRVDELFELTARERPDALAVTFLEQSVSYDSLCTRTLELATRLQNLGVQPGTLVGICMDRSMEMVAALLATFKTGAAYLPLDPAFPPDRIEFMQQDARPLVVITQSHLREKFLFSATNVLCIDGDMPALEVNQVRRFSPPRNSSLDDVAYVLYTSGSTGKPKGVQIRHGALTNMLVAVAKDIALTSADVVLATTTISFDISTFEIFAPLITGARLVVAPRSVAIDGQLLAKAIHEHAITVLQATPAGWQILLESGWEGQAGLKMLTAGEPLTWILAQRLLERGAGLWNLYGPTETTVYATGIRIQKDTKITVGRPLTNCTAHVLDEHQERLPVGATGELFLGGICVGAGYLNRPELTAERFIPDPFSIKPGAQLYRTGDLARALPNGEIDLLGRADNQVKLRGYRIELEEVEAVLDSHPSISKSVAKVVSMGEDNQCLVAYVVAKDKNKCDEADWLQHAVQTLPWYMVPASFMVVESFLLTPNGKVDRKALPAFHFSRPVDAEAGPEVQEDCLELAVLHCWRTVLDRPDIGLDHDFFQAGGHSLQAMRILAELNKKLSLKIPVSYLVEAPTARKFAELLMRTKHDPARYLISMQPQGSLAPVYFIHHLLGDVLIYHSVASQFAPERPVFGVQPPLDFMDRPQPYGLQALASDYVGEILRRQPEGPIHLAGFSSGSVIAFEMARQFKNLGHEVGLLALIDGGVSVDGPPMPAAVKYAKMMRRKLCKIAFKMEDELAEGPKQFVMKRVKHVFLNSRVRALENSALKGEMTMEQALLLAERAYKPEPYAGSALLIRFHDEAWEYGPDPFIGWSGLVKSGIDIVDLEGGHITGMSPAGAPTMVAILTNQINKTEAAIRMRTMAARESRPVALSGNLQ